MAPKMTRDSELIRTARAVLSLQRKIAKARRQIKGWRADLKHERKMLRGLAYAGDNRPDVAPSRLTGGVTGYVVQKTNATLAIERTLAERKAAPDVSGILDAIGVEEPPAPTLTVSDGARAELKAIARGLSAQKRKRVSKQ